MPKQERDFIITQYCIDYGLVMRSKNNLCICDNPKCKTCTPWREVMDELTEEFVRESVKELINKPRIKLKDKKSWQRKMNQKKSSKKS